MIFVHVIQKNANNILIIYLMHLTVIEGLLSLSEYAVSEGE